MTMEMVTQQLKVADDAGRQFVVISVFRERVADVAEAAIAMDWHVVSVWHGMASATNILLRCKR